MSRDQGYYRWQRNRTIQRKIGILKRLGGNILVYAWTRGQYGRLAKVKIHCSCYLCRSKSYDSTSHRDRKCALAAVQRLKDGRYIC